MERAISTLRLLPETREQQNRFAQQIVEHVTDGYGDVMEVELFLRAIENVIKDVRKNTEYKDVLEDEVYANPAKTFKVKTANITKGQRTTYDFSGDHTWAELKKSITEREKLLKTVNDHNKVVDEDTGECLVQPGRKYTEYLQVKFD